MYLMLFAMYVFFLTGVALAIANAAGDELDQECRRYLQNYDLKVSEICLTTAGNMPSKKVTDYSSYTKVISLIEYIFIASLKQL